MDDRVDAIDPEDVVARADDMRFQALRRAIDEEDWAAATAVVRNGWFALVTDENSEQTRILLERVPPAVLREEPLLAAELGIVCHKLRFHRLRATRHLVTAVLAARSAGNPDLGAVDRVLIRAAEAGAFRILGRTGSSVTAARAAYESANALSDEDRASVSDLPRIYAVIGVSLFYGGFPEDALEAAARGLAEAPTTPPSTGMGALALLAGVHALRGDLPFAAEYIDYARTGPWSDRQRNMYSGVLYRVAEAVVALERFDADGALAVLGSMIHGRYGTEHWTTIAQVRATAELVGGRPGKGLAELDAFVAEHAGAGRSPRVREQLGRIRSLLQLALGNPDAAAAIVRRDLTGGATARIERARIALALGQSGDALDGIRSLAGEHLSTREAADAAAIEAAVLLRISPTPRQEGVVDRLGALLERSGQRLAVALLPPDDVGRVVRALHEAGYASVAAEIPTAPLLRDAEPELLLTKRELAVLEQLMVTGSVSEIAAALVVSANTVKTQLRSIYRKLGVGGRQDAIAVALERHLLVERD